MPKNGDSAFHIARSIFKSDIWEGDPHLLKLWIYFLGKALWKKNSPKYGELTTSLRQIQQDNFYTSPKSIVKKYWSRHKISNMLKQLERDERIICKETSKGTVIQIIKYGEYQDLYKYKRDVLRETKGTDVSPEDQKIDLKLALNKGGHSVPLPKPATKAQKRMQEEGKNAQKGHEGDTRLQKIAPNQPPKAPNNVNNIKKKEYMIWSQIKNLLSKFPSKIRGLIEEYIEIARLENETKRITLQKRRRLINELHLLWTSCNHPILQSDFEGALRITINNEAPNVNYVKKVMKSIMKARSVRLKKGKENKEIMKEAVSGHS